VPKAGDTSIQTFGRAAPDADFVAVANAVQAFDIAVASANDQTACSLLASTVKKQLTQLASRAPSTSSGAGTDNAPKTCENILGKFLSAQTPAASRQLRHVRVTDARVNGDSGFAIYQMPGVGQSAEPVVREGGQWKVAALGRVPLQ
jgi:hypothetical protein